MTIPTPNRRSPHFWVDLFNNFRLTWRLLRDQQVPFAAIQQVWPDKLK